MKRIMILVISLIFVSFFTGCVLNDISVKSSQNFTESVDTIRQVSGEFLKRWPIESGIIRAYFGDNFENLPCNCASAMDALDVLATKYSSGEITDMDLGYAYGYRLKLLSEAIRTAIEKVAPPLVDALKLL